MHLQAVPAVSNKVGWSVSHHVAIPSLAMPRRSSSIQYSKRMKVSL